MGYYTGSGVVTGGGSTVSLRSFGPSVGGAYYTYNRTNSTVVTKNGVSLATAQAARGSIDMSYYQYPSGSPVPGLIEPSCKGTNSSVGYSQISGSNLYSLTVTSNEVQFRGKVGTWDSGWVS